MDCKDLMVGDWVSYKDDPPYMVRGTSICKVVTIDNGIDHRNVMDDAISPIPLTDEILEKNGFVKTWNGDWQLKEYATIIVSKDYYVKIFERSIRIDFVHELQHALHAACIVKEIEL